MKVHELISQLADLEDKDIEVVFTIELLGDKPRVPGEEPHAINIGWKHEWEPEVIFDDGWVEVAEEWPLAHPRNEYTKVAVITSYK